MAGGEGGVRPLGVFGASELRVGGMPGRGFLQPLMAAGPGSAGPSDSEAVSGLARRGQVVNSPDGWKAVARLAEVLDAAAAARSLVACPPADVALAAPPGSDVMGADRIAMGRLGSTDLVLDLLPSADGYRARLAPAATVAGELAEWCGLGRADPAGDSRSPVVEGGREWEAAVAAGLLAQPVPPIIETATVTAPDRPLLQQRITQLEVPIVGGDHRRSERWLALAVVEGGDSSLSAAPAGPVRVRQALLQALLGRPVRL